MIKDNIVKIDVVVVALSLVILMGLIGYARPLVIAPMDDFESSDGNILFSFERADILLIDDNVDFTTPDKYQIVDGEKIRLEPGIYYWKVRGVLKSEVRKLTIKSRVELKLVETKDGMAVVNSGNVRLNVDVYDGEKLIENKKLGVGDISNIKGTKYIGEME